MKNVVKGRHYKVHAPNPAGGDYFWHGAVTEIDTPADRHSDNHAICILVKAPETDNPVHRGYFANRIKDRTTLAFEVSVLRPVRSLFTVKAKK